MTVICQMTVTLHTYAILGWPFSSVRSVVCAGRSWAETVTRRLFWAACAVLYSHHKAPTFCASLSSSSAPVSSVMVTFTCVTNTSFGE